MKLMCLRIHFGEPNNPTEIRSYTGSYGLQDKPWHHSFVSHRVAKWYGVSYKRSWFFGFSVFGTSYDYRSYENMKGVDV